MKCGRKVGRREGENVGGSRLRENQLLKGGVHILC